MRPAKTAFLSLTALNCENPNFQVMTYQVHSLIPAWVHGGISLWWLKNNENLYHPNKQKYVDMCTKHSTEKNVWFSVMKQEYIYTI
jgi:hypothetical protein